MNLLTICLYEFYGAFVLLFGVHMMGSNLFVPPLALMIAIVTTGGISGGHHNPAVTMGVYIVESKWADNFKVLLCAWISQVFGAFFGTFIVETIKGHENLTRLSPGPAYIDGLGFGVFLMEIFATFVFVSVILH
jgi:glycerol uptake facilitator-like aquaporin